MGSWKRSPDSLGALLAAADPVDRSRLTTDGIGRVLDAMGMSIMAQEGTKAPALRSRRWTRKPRLVLLVGALIVAATATVAVAATWSAHTGAFQPTEKDIANASPSQAATMKSELSMGGPGEFLDPSAPDFREVALQVASDVPYPEGYESWRDFLISRETRLADGSGTMTTGALHGWFAGSAFCAWVQAWRQAELRGDVAAATHAAQMISAAPGWKAVTDEDPRPDPTVQGDGGSTQFTLFGWMLPYRDAVSAGDRARVEQLLASGYGDKPWVDDPAWNAFVNGHPEWGTLDRAGLAEKYRAFLAGARS
jgi:hypothetical protein